MKTCDPWGFLLEEKNEQMLLYPFWRSLDVIHQTLRTFACAPAHVSSERLYQMTLEHLRVPLLRSVKRVLVYEFQQKRQFDPHLTLANFLESLSQENALIHFFEKYPVLYHAIQKMFDQHQHYLNELRERLKTDLAELTTLFHLHDYVWESITIEGDPHCFGRRVALIKFQRTTAKGGNPLHQTIVYKPRDICLEKKFNDYLAFVSDNLQSIPLKTIFILCKPGYGWLEYIEQIKIDEALIPQYYYKFGILLGICHMLNGRDFHFENLIASGDNPMIVDPECLFSVPITPQQETNPHFPSLFETNLIPPALPLENGKTRYDLSPLLNHSKKQSFMQRYKVAGDFSNIVYIEQEPILITPGKNRLIHQRTSKPISASSYANIIAEGYATYMHWVIANREKVLQFINQHFMNLKIRVVFRPTFIYVKMLIASFHPVWLSDAKKYSECFESMRHSENHLHQAIYASEWHDIQNGDIPYFSMQTTGTCILDSQEKPIDWVAKCTGFQRVVERLDVINEDFIQECMKQILASLNPA